MSHLDLTHACPVCGAESSLDVVIYQVLEDGLLRQHIASVLTKSLPVGGMVISYLRLHKPAKQRLKLTKARTVVEELVTDICRGAITRKGREWAAPLEAWRQAFAAVFEARDKGTLTLPLDGNAYLYEVLLRTADKVEAKAEKAQEQEARGRTFQAGPQALADVVPVAPWGIVPTATPTAEKAKPSDDVRRKLAEAKQALKGA